MTVQILAQDTLNLVFRQLSGEDVLIASENTTQQVASGSRSLKDIKDVPFTIYVVSKEEIQKYGFVTLVDVLESLPGIRVAQPSSGSFGEAFLMRGLLGNVYAKILINDLPVKPSAAEGMPLGAQLPIQQAERIEITFGPTIGIYGGDAAAGVINIITTQTERPFYVQADVGLGSQGYSNLSVLLAGKVGRDKEVVKFSIFGSYTDFEDRRVVYDKDYLYNPSTYLSDSSTFSGLNNYRGTVENPAFKDLPHQSKLIGAQLNYKAFRFYFEQLERQDHSALGLNPVTVSYANPSTYIGESITRLNAGFFEEREKWVFRLDATGVLYQLDPGSSILLVQNNLYNGLGNLMDSIPSNFDTLKIQKNAATIYEQLLSNQRFMYAASNDFWIEPLVTVAATNWLEFSLGGSFQFSDNQPFINYLPVPFESDNTQNQREQQLGFQNIAYQPDKEQFNNIAFYFQQYLNFDKFDVLGAVRYDYHSKYKSIWSGHLAGNYKLGETLSARISYGTAFQVPNTFWEASSLGLTFLEDSLIVSSAYSFGHPDLEYVRSRSFEVGLRWGSKDNFETDIVYFRSNTQNLIAQRQYLWSESPVVLIDAYENDPNASMTIRGFQARIKVDITKFASGYLNLQRAEGEETLPFGGGQLNEVREQPKWTWQARLVTKLSQKLFLQSTITASQAWVSSNLTEASLLENDTTKERFVIPKYTVLDLMLRYQLSEEFQGFIRGFNVLNKRYGGIQVGRSEENLIFNPQSQFTFSVGLNYRMK